PPPSLHTLLLSFLPSASPAPATSSLSLPDALPIWIIGIDGNVALAVDRKRIGDVVAPIHLGVDGRPAELPELCIVDIADAHIGINRKSTRLNSSHVKISYAVFCLKKKTRKRRNTST